MKAAFEIAAFVFGAGIAWLFSGAVKDKFERATKIYDRRMLSIIIWAAFGVLAAGIFLWPWILYGLGYSSN
jgi:hypothetical protein